MRTLLPLPFFFCCYLVHAQTDMSLENQAPLEWIAQPSDQQVSSRDLSDECLPQAAGRFWSIADGAIREWTISGSTITQGDIVVQGTADMNSLAFCSASGVTTFYCDRDVSGLKYYVDGEWVSALFPYSVYNHGGSGEHLYFVDMSNYLFHFSGTTATLIADPSPGSFRADIVVREDGNAIVLYSPSGMGAFATEFRVYSPDGTILHTYSTSFDPTHSWGAFLLNTTVYIAFGATNSQYAGHLVPFTLSGTTAQAGTPIPFLQGAMFDLASCTEDVSIGFPDHRTRGLDVQVFLDEAGENLTIMGPDAQPLRSIEIYEANGRLVHQRHAASNTSIVPVSGWVKGIYVVRIGGGAIRFVKQ